MDLLAYLVNLADDLEATLAAAAVTPELLASLNTELHEVATKLTAGDSIPQLSEIEGLVVREETCLDEHERAWLDDKDAPF
jgi:hypothetical protein